MPLFARIPKELVEKDMMKRQAQTEKGLVEFKKLAKTVSEENNLSLTNEKLFEMLEHPFVKATINKSELTDDQKTEYLKKFILTTIGNQ